MLDKKVKIMSNSEIQWTSNGSKIPNIEPHTKTKHLLTEQYVTDLVYTLYGSGRHGITNFTIIDGFCGGGIYNDPDSQDLWYGSPIRLINAVRKGYFKSKRTHQLNVKFIFIDRKKQHLDCLKTQAVEQAGFGTLLDEKPHVFKTEYGEIIEECEFLCNEFENLVDYCIVQADSRRGHSLFFLDPFGWDDVSIESFRKINSLNKSEVIYTFMTNYIKRFVFHKNGKEREKFMKILEAHDHFDPQYLTSLDQFGEQAYYRDQLMCLLRNRGHAKRIITFSVFNTVEHSVFYYLVHISSHLRALEVMKDSIWTHNNLDYQYHYDIFGHGFKTSNYYQENQLDLQLDIIEDSQDFCIQRLSQDLDKIIENNREGITFKELRNLTMELNPATKDQYYKYLKILRDNKKIEIISKNKVTNKYKLDNNDIIRLPDKIQLCFFS